MTLLTACKALAKNVGLDVPNEIIGSSNREWVEAQQFANEAGEELARRVDWEALQASTTLTGDGTNQTFTMPSGFDHLRDSGAVVDGNTILRPLTRSEWRTLTAVEGEPRYYLLEGSSVTLWPYLADAETVTAYYQTNLFANNSGSGDVSAFVSDADTLNVDEDLFIKCLIVRWRRQKGMDYADYEAEYEAALSDVAGFSGARRF